MKKGFFYTISIFLLASVALEFMAYSVEQRSRLRADFPLDAEYMAETVDMLRTVHLQALGVQMRTSRSGAAVSVELNESGFPLPTSSGGRIASSYLTNLTSQFAQLRNCSIAANLTLANTTGVVLMGNAANYTQDNTQSEYDNTTLSLPPGFGLTRLYARIRCSMPSASTVAYNAWGAPPGASLLDTNFTSSSPAGGTSTSNPLFDLNYNDSFSADYTDGTNWLATVKMATIYNSTDRLVSVWSYINTSAVAKSALNCSWDLAADINFTATSQPMLQYIPIPIAASCQNSGFVGNMAVSSS